MIRAVTYQSGCTDINFYTFAAETFSQGSSTLYSSLFLQSISKDKLSVVRNSHAVR